MKTIFKGVEKLQENQFLEDTQKKDLKKIKLGFCLGEFEKKSEIWWERDEGVVFGRRVKKEKVASAAEVKLDGLLLERLRREAAKMREWVKVKKAGVTEAVVDQIHSIWESNELAKLKFDLPLCHLPISHGPDDKYDTLRTQIINMDLFPNIDRVYAMVMLEESYRGITDTQDTTSAVGFHAQNGLLTARSSGLVSATTGDPNCTPTGRPWCTFCHWVGHTQEKFYRRLGIALPGKE
ncbi:hypothetical protein RJ639_030998 [Escallonia herrerae]|uniref:CRM domain-containing protein n=1 Tax=Escallonia herrerae TaxID=1293975 RepID=A0AA89BHC9_9ASTE|nr:hypothetical protein RJ639_030998 [Escallonia herrerae]